MATPIRSTRPWVGWALIATLIIGRDGRAADPNPPDGEALYLSRCGDCHGRDGRGDGPDAFLFSPPPRDLHDGFLEQHETRQLVRRILDGAIMALPFDPKELRARADESEAIVGHLETLPDRDWRQIARGQRIYLTRCQGCHGIYGHVELGAQKAPPDLSAREFQRARSDAHLLATVREGHRETPPSPIIRDDRDARAVVAFVRALSPGFELYSRYCAVCHGADGRPARVVEPLRRPTVAFDRAYLAGHDPERLRVRVWHMLEENKPMMPHFRGDLDEGEARAIVDHLRKAKRSRTEP
jgi:mono/diheme cytochrome c family protein